MTERQFKLLRFIKNKVVHLGQGPTFREMRQYMGVTSNQTVKDWLKILERGNFIREERGKARGIIVTSKGMLSASKSLRRQNMDIPSPVLSASRYGDFTSAEFTPSVYLFNNLPPSIINQATL